MNSKQTLWPFRGKWRRMWREDPVDMSFLIILTVLGIAMVGAFVMLTISLIQAPYGSI